MIAIVKVSVIVPVYNSRKYLKECIESIINQDLEEIELILVNDGSTDNSLDICQKYAMKDSRIKIIDKPNGGVSSARNAGILAASGEYIGFVDSDDWIQSEMYSNMYKNIKETGSNICICNYIEESFGNSKPITLNIKKRILLKEDIINELVLNMIGPKDLNSNSEPIMGNIWRLLFKKDFIKEYNLNFPINIHFMEDLLFCIKAFIKAKQITIDNGYYYYYRNNSNSASRSYINDIYTIQKNIFDIIENIIKGENLFDIAAERLNIRYVNLCIGSVINEVCKNNNIKIKNKISTIKNICNDEKLNQILRGISTKGYTFRKKTVLFALKYKFSIYLYAYYKLTYAFSRLLYIRGEK